MPETSSSDSSPFGDSGEDAAFDALLNALASPPRARPMPEPGERVGEGDRYRLDRQLGRGGQGVVFLSHDLKLDRPVAVKFAQPRQDEDDRAWEARCEAFDHEIRLLAQLQHDHIVTTHDRGLWNGIPFLVMAYLQGETLSAMLARDGRLDPARALNVALQIAQALKAAHELGVIHRDLKPDNIFMLQGEDRARVLDFGMAWFNPPPHGDLANEVPLDEAERRHGGTASYMAPEQWERAGDQDARTDIWAFGVILFEMLMGHHPYRHENLSPKTAILTGRMHPISLDPSKPETKALTRLINRCLETDRDLRPTNIYLVLRDLTQIQRDLNHGSAAPERSADPSTELAGRTWHKKARWGAAILGMLLLAVVAWGSEIHNDRAEFQNRINIYAHKAGADTHKLCLGKENRAFAMCVFGPHTRTSRDGGSFHPVTLVVFAGDLVNPL